MYVNYLLKIELLTDLKFKVMTIPTTTTQGVSFAGQKFYRFCGFQLNQKVSH